MRNSLNKVIVLLCILVFSSGIAVAQSEQVWNSPHNSFGESPCYAVDTEPMYSYDSLCAEVNALPFLKAKVQKQKLYAKLLIGIDGSVKDCQVLNGENERFENVEKLAIELFKKVSFHPALFQGRAIESWIGIPLYNTTKIKCFE